MMMHPQNGKGGGDDERRDFVAVLCATGASFLWADPAYEWSINWFQNVAIQNYGHQFLEAFQWAYWGTLHLAIFGVTRVAVNWALIMIITNIGYRFLMSSYG
ncbi:hypothetical protein [Leisingera caerulea]|uniref:hypothetical protein n=1 Tax=Leisingera caerulea TaxID=506591 RepID=UPI00042938BB|nr:hypothetical protein [Leisingera caerulea]